jgi:hypothetical protein
MFHSCPSPLSDYTAPYYNLRLTRVSYHATLPHCATTSRYHKQSVAKTRNLAKNIRRILDSLELIVIRGYAGRGLLELEDVIDGFHSG